MTFNADIVKAINNNDLNFFQSTAISQDEFRKIFNGRTYLDLALINQRHQIADILQALGVKQTLAAHEIQRLKINEKVISDQDYDYTIKFENSNDKKNYCSITTFDSIKKKIIHNVVLSKNEFKSNLKKENVVCRTDSGVTSIAILVSKTTLTTKILLKINQDKLFVSAANKNLGHLSIESHHHIEFEGMICAADLFLKASSFTLPKESACKAHDISLCLSSDISLAGTLIGTSLKACAENLNHLGSTIMVQGFNFECSGQAQLSGQLCSTMESRVSAHYIRVNRESMISVERGLLKLVGTASVKNAGVLRAGTLLS